LTRKDYVLLARAFNAAMQRINFIVDGDLPHKHRVQGYDFALKEVADMLAEDNPRFDRERFIFAAIGRKAI
jgi:hypothetical protein